MPEPARLRYLWAYTGAGMYCSWHDRLLERRRKSGYDVEHFRLNPPSVGEAWLPFHELDYRWRTRERTLMEMYEQLAEKLRGRDVLVHYNGANIHPEFLSFFHLTKVYTFCDTESAPVLSHPVAPAYDIQLVADASIGDQYGKRGWKNVHFCPLGSVLTEDDVSDLNEDVIADIQRRTVPTVFFGGRSWYLRKSRLQRLADAFPDSYCAGEGWPRGFVPWEDKYSIYRKAQIGWNVHNTTGPINFRTYELPACGVMQVCDCKSHLGKVFEIGKEVEGFENTRECVDLVRHYLAHPDQQREMAVAAWRRWKRDYTPDQVWRRITAIVEDYVASRKGPPAGALPEVAVTPQTLREQGKGSRTLAGIARKVAQLRWFARRVVLRLLWPLRLRRR